MKDTVTKKQLREFGLLIGFGFPILIGWLLPSIFGHEFRSFMLRSFGVLVFGSEGPGVWRAFAFGRLLALKTINGGARVGRCRARLGCSVCPRTGPGARHQTGRNLGLRRRIDR